MNQNTNTHTQEIDEDEIDLKEVFSTLSRYKYSIVAIAIAFMLVATVFAYFKPNVYESSITIELEEEKSFGGAQGDMMAMALGGSGANLDNEQYILTSRFLAQKLLHSLEIGTRYFTKNNLRTVELYRASPFIVTYKEIDKKLWGARFEIQVLDKERFVLSMKPKVGIKEKLLVTLGLIEAPADSPKPYENEHRFADEIVTEWFSIKIDKVFELEESAYSFSIVPNDQMYKFIQESLSTSLVSKQGSIVKVNFQDNIALRAEQILNGLAQRYLDQELEEKTLEADQTLRFIDAQIEEINQDVEKSQGELEAFRSKHTLVNASEQAMMTAENMAEYQGKLQELEIESNILNNIQEYVNAGKDLAGISLGSAAYLDPSLAQMVSKLQEATSERKGILIEFTELHPDVVKLTEMINSIKASIRFTLKSDITMIEQRKKSLRHYIRKYKRSLEALPENERQLANLTRNTMVNEKVYNFLLEKRAETAILRSSTVSKTRVIDSALVGDLPVKPKRLLIILVGMILGFIVGIAVAFLRAFLDDTIKSNEDVEKLTDIPMYGVLPHLKDNTSRVQFDEAMRVLRTNIEFVHSDDATAKIVAMTSSISGEGKTTVSVALSKMIAATQKRVIIIDLDLRRSRMHEEFTITNKHGVSSVLANKKSLDEVIQSNVFENLDVLTAGPIPPNPSELLVSGNFDKMIEQLKTEYDYIILDTAPVGLVTDAMTLLKLADVGLIVTRANYSKKAFLKNVERFAQTHNLNNLGFVLNGVISDKSHGYGYGYGYGYGNADAYYENQQK